MPVSLLSDFFDKEQFHRLCKPGNVNDETAAVFIALLTVKMLRRFICLRRSQQHRIPFISFSQYSINCLPQPFLWYFSSMKSILQNGVLSQNRLYRSKPAGVPSSNMTYPLLVRTFSSNSAFGKCLSSRYQNGSSSFFTYRISVILITALLFHRSVFSQISTYLPLRNGPSRSTLR